MCVNVCSCYFLKSQLKWTYVQHDRLFKIKSHRYRQAWDRWKWHANINIIFFYYFSNSSKRFHHHHHHWAQTGRKKKCHSEREKKSCQKCEIYGNLIYAIARESTLKVDENVNDVKKAKIVLYVVANTWRMRVEFMSDE